MKGAPLKAAFKGRTHIRRDGTVSPLSYFLVASARHRVTSVVIFKYFIILIDVFTLYLHYTDYCGFGSSYIALDDK